MMMKCDKCSEVILVQPGKSANFCSNCGNKMEAEKSSGWQFFDNTKDLLAFITLEYGIDALFGKKHFSDHTAPLMPAGQKNLVKQAYDCGAVRVLQDNMSSDQSRKEIAIKQAVGKIIDTYASAQEAAERVVWELTNAIGWGMPEPINQSGSRNDGTNPAVSRTPVTIVGGSGLSAKGQNLMKRGWQCAEDGDWDDAHGYFQKVLDEEDADYALAYLGLLCVSMKVSVEDKLSSVNGSASITDHKYYRRAIADPVIKARLDGYVRDAEKNKSISITVKAGSLYKFAGYDWRVLKSEDSRLLLLSDKVLETRPYHQPGGEITWERCTLRQYLNSEFYDSLGESKLRIANTSNNNPNNLWYGTNGGGATTDKIFLLSLEEVDNYFGNSGDYINKRRKTYEGTYPNGKWVTATDGWGLSNENDNSRIAKGADGKAWWWWLRSPGGRSDLAALVDAGGLVLVHGNVVSAESGGVSGGVRPALWLNL